MIQLNKSDQKIKHEYKLKFRWFCSMSDKFSFRKSLKYLF